MYEEYYGFTHTPFSLTPDPRFLYRSESHDVALRQVMQAIRRKEGFIVLTGDIGTGKTTLCRTLLEQFDSTTFAALILNPFVTVEELIRELLVSFGVASKEALRTGGLATASKHVLVRTLHDFLLSLAPLRASAVVIVDEAQHLSTDVLEEIRILSNLETNEQKLLQIVLVGQLNLLDVLHDAKLRQLDQRITLRSSLRALTRAEVEAYISHRLSVARGSQTVRFTSRAVDRVHAVSSGIPRVINLTCDRALMAAAEANTSDIGETLVMDAVKTLGLAPPPDPEKPRRGTWQSLLHARHSALATRPFSMNLVWVAAVLVGLLVIAALVYGFVVRSSGNERDQGSIVPPAGQAPSLRTPAPAVAPEPPAAGALTSEPRGSGRFTVFIAAFDAPRDAARAEATLRARALPVYAVDLRAADGNVSRRLFVGRFASGAEAVAAQQKVAALFPTARVVTMWQEREQ
ncbi:MAG TPA: AAA family ATPase [Vicinamibacterales bacterium]|nr:AAA family ATPase [Vicinamibacterales bacterium]